MVCLKAEARKNSTLEQKNKFAGLFRPVGYKQLFCVTYLNYSSKGIEWEFYSYIGKLISSRIFLLPNANIDNKGEELVLLDETMARQP